MTVTAKNIRTQQIKIKSHLDQLSGLLEERSRIISDLKLSPSKSDNLDLINLLAKIQTELKYQRQDISSGFAADYASDFSSIVDSYTQLLDSLKEDPYVDTQEYVFTEKVATEEPDTSARKSVRFKDYDGDDTEDTEHLRSQLMGTSTNFRPYRDEPDEDADRNTLLSVDTTNQELFAQHQQQLLEQDQNLDQLHDLVRVQHSMGRSINEELDEHLIILNDLERGVDNSSTRLGRASNNIRQFQRKVRENGSLATIIVLTVILIVLLVVLN
ncbi:CIC11C00000004036 [Sungouiella intermedia]|uniref:CIC11C00000004036 n=1 Tax=Sungouiella intermedia TaxID=45354 RepID=A0A1L0B9F0_9ASCO|nr:CIC11C00000004036 [[Candida] intermedia]